MTTKTYGEMTKEELLDAIKKREEFSNTCLVPRENDIKRIAENNRIIAKLNENILEEKNKYLNAIKHSKERIKNINKENKNFDKESIRRKKLKEDYDIVSDYLKKMAEEKQ